MDWIILIISVGILLAVQHWYNDLRNIEIVLFYMMGVTGITVSLISLIFFGGNAI